MGPCLSTKDDPTDDDRYPILAKGPDEYKGVVGASLSARGPQYAYRRVATSKTRGSA